MRDLRYLWNILIQWNQLIYTEYVEDIYLMEYLKVENDFQLLLASVLKISHETLGSHWRERLGYADQELFMDLEYMSIKSLQRIVFRLRNSSNGEAIVSDILKQAHDADSPYFRAGGRYANLTELVCRFIREPTFD